MSTWAIVLIVIACILVLAGLGVLIWWLVKRSKKKKSSTKPTINHDGSKPVRVQLTAVALKKGKGITGYETEEELQARLSKLTRDEFEQLEVIDFPYGHTEWEALGNDADKILKRNNYEISMYFAYDVNKKLIEDNIIVREF